MSHSARTRWLALVLLACGCSASSSDDAEEGAGAATATPAQTWLGDWLAVIGDKPSFAVVGAANATTPTVKLGVDDSDVVFDFTGFGGDAHALDPLSRLLHFPRPEGAATTAPSLGDDTFSTALGKELSVLYTKQPGATTDPDYAGALDRVTTARSACAPSTGSSTANGGCHIFEKQSASGEAVSTFELASLVVYTGDEFAPMNTLLRSRTFQPPTGDAPKDPAATAYAIDGVFALGAMSALNRLDKVTSTTYRGTTSLHASCAPTGPALAATPTTVDAAVTRFCGYFDAATTYRDCAFTSSSTDPGVAMDFSQARTTLSGKAPVSPPVILEIDGKSGVLVERLSRFTNEHEVLLKPNAALGVVPKSGAIMLVPAGAGIITTYDKFEKIACGQTLTDDQKARISHFRVKLKE